MNREAKKRTRLNVSSGVFSEEGEGTSFAFLSEPIAPALSLRRQREMNSPLSTNWIVSKTMTYKFVHTACTRVHRGYE